MKKILFSVLLIFSFKNLQSQAIYYLIYDRDKSEKMGAEDILAINRAFATWQDSYMIPQINDNRGLLNRTLSVSYRFGKTFLLDNIWNDLSRVVQHEVFGHGSRLREAGYTRNRYYIQFPAPFYGGGGTATYGRREEGRFIGRAEKNSFRFGGVESNTIMANSIRWKWFSTGKIYYREAYQYYRTFNNVTRYIRNTSNDESNGINDMYSYTNTLADAYDMPLDDSPLRIEQLKKKMLINYFNPLQYLAVYALLKGYIWDGNTEMEIPMLPIGPIEYFPIVRMGLAPFGTEVYVENLIRHQNTLHLVQARFSDGLFDKAWGVAYANNRIIDNKWLWLQGELNVWNQPGMELGGEELVQTEDGMGGAIQLGAHFKTSKKENSSAIYLQAGYKTAGFLEGERLRETWLIRFGLAFYQQ